MRVFGYKLSICRIHRKIRWDAVEGKIRLPIEWQNNIPFINCLVNEVQARMMIDTGANVNVICQSSISKLGICASGSYQGHFERDCLKQSENLGTCVIRIANSVSIESAPIIAGLMAPNFSYDGILSNTILRDLHAAIDYKINAVVFEKNLPNKAVQTVPVTCSFQARSGQEFSAE